MTAALATLNPAARVTLADCEQRIERGLRTFIDVGQALAEIRDSRLYKASHGTFEEYCRERWNFSDRRASQFIEAASVIPKILGTGLPAPTVESQARALAAVPEPERAEVWREAVESTGGKPTAKAVTEIAKARTETPEPVAVPSTAATGSGSTSPEPERHLSVVPEQARGEAGEQLRIELLRESERRTAIASIRSVLTYLTSRVLEPAVLAQDYLIALDEFSAAELRFAAETMTAIAALKEQF